ncbi:MAG TPA: tRNA (adenosine(37)-N6)-threonylcarbamoyltransferase complex dimerization subunit type 1 TsaB [Treponemataceae bacterium]|jgi:tRNA threonylcarbamoyladenosine biosynthesis protein TsaB|nr:tRNA (adenosine(37)-N6)-threonylcarbamoyltransferase complex dimerization subunit type 1 TsaB [Treponemataceae bacterium]
MNILAIDSLTAALSVSACSLDRSATVTCSGLGQHAERMVDLVARALDIVGVEPRAVQLIACPEGPGSFTGLRLAYAAAKGIQLAAGCPLLPVPTLELYAHGLADWPGAVVAALDAKKERFYLQVFRRGEAATGPLDASEADCARLLDPEERVIVVGPDAQAFLERLRGAFPAIDAAALPTAPDQAVNALMARAKAAFACYTNPVPDHAGPVYVRKSDAEASAT